LRNGKDPWDSIFFVRSVPMVAPRYEEIRYLKCQACRKKFTIRKNTVPYRLKTHSEMAERILWLIGLGVDASALEEMFGIQEITIRSWLWRSGVQGNKMHERFMVELVLIHVQLDELRVNAKSKGRDLWLWAATDTKTKIVPVLQVGGRTQEMAYSVVHEIKGRLRAGCVPVFSIVGAFIYGQVIKHQRRRRTVEVERRMQAVGLSERINTSFIERLNLTIRQCVSKFTRRTWGPTRYKSELMEHLAWWRSYYHFVRYHESLEVKLSTPIERKGKQRVQRIRQRTPAMAAGLTDRRWAVKELLGYPLP
jgi:IS1 family transposase